MTCAVGREYECYASSACFAQECKIRGNWASRLGFKMYNFEVSFPILLKLSAAELDSELNGMHSNCCDENVYWLHYPYPKNTNACACARNMTRKCGHYSLRVPRNKTVSFVSKAIHPPRGDWWFQVVTAMTLSQSYHLPQGDRWYWSTLLIKNYT